MKSDKLIISFFRKHIVGLWWVAALLTSCADKEPIPDVSHIEVPVHIRRFEQDLFAIDTSQVAGGIALLQEQYPEFAPLFFKEVIGAYDPMLAPDGPEVYIRGLLTHPAVRQLYDTTQIVFADLEPVQQEFGQALKFFKYYFPQQPVPDLTTFISEYTLAAFIYGDNRLAVGLDFFLGADYPYQRYNPGNPNFSRYLVRSFNKDHLVMKALQPLVEDLVGPVPGNRLIDYMVHNGKKLYIMDHLLPFKPDTVIFEYSPAQLQWCFDNERDMWAFFTSEDLLYSTDYVKWRKMVEYSPNSPGMPPEAPGRTANFIGWRIVSAYMKRHPEVSMEQLITLRDAQAILDGSRYKPQR